MLRKLFPARTFTWMIREEMFEMVEMALYTTLYNLYMYIIYRRSLF